MTPPGLVVGALFFGANGKAATERATTDSDDWTASDEDGAIGAVNVEATARPRSMTRMGARPAPSRRSNDVRRKRQPTARG